MNDFPAALARALAILADEGVAVPVDVVDWLMSAPAALCQPSEYVSVFRALVTVCGGGRDSVPGGEG